MVDVNVLDVNAIVDASQYVPQVDSGLLGLFANVPVVGQLLASLSVNDIGILIALGLLLLWSFKGKAVLQILQIVVVGLILLVFLGVINF